MLLGIAFNLTGERDDPSICCDANMSRRDTGFPFQFGQYGKFTGGGRRELVA